MLGAYLVVGGGSRMGLAGASGLLATKATETIASRSSSGRVVSI